MKEREQNYHPLIAALPVVTIDVPLSYEDQKKYSGYSTWFFEVPTEMVINGDRDLWKKHCPPLVNWDMLACIKEIKAKGEFPYNRDVGNLFCQKFNPTATYDDGTFLSAVVYCTQQYEHAVAAEEAAQKLHTELLAQGFVQTTEEMLKEAAGTKRKFQVVMNHTNLILGNEFKAVADSPMVLKDWGEKGFYWMKPRTRKTGWKAQIGQFIKEAV